MADAKIDKWLKEGRGGYTTEELREAFHKVADKEHWKNGYSSRTVETAL